MNLYFFIETKCKKASSILFKQTVLTNVKYVYKEKNYCNIFSTPDV